MLAGRAMSAMSSGPATSATQDRLAAVEGFSNHDGRGVTGVVDGRAVLVGRAHLARSRSGPSTPPPTCSHPPRPRGRRSDSRLGRLGRRGPAASSWWPTPSRHLSAGHCTVPHTRASTNPAHRRQQQSRSRGRRPGGIGRQDVISEVLPAGKASEVKACRPAEASWQWLATGSTMPPLWLRPTWACHGHRQRRGHRGLRPNLVRGDLGLPQTPSDFPVRP